MTEAETEEDQLPKYTWWVLGLAAVLLLGLTAGGIGFISAGFFDPKPVGTLTAVIDLQAVSIPAESESIQWLDDGLATADSFTVRLTAAYQSGALDSGYGLAVGGEEAALITAVSPLGYAFVGQVERPLGAAIDEGQSNELDGMIANGPEDSGGWSGLETAVSGDYILPWQRWPHVKQGVETNEIWLDKQGEMVTIYINRELLWAGSVSGLASGIGLYGGSFEGAALISFEGLEVFE